jgi:hypothetical protein
MEIPVEVLQKNLNIGLSQQSIDRFLVENLRRAQRPRREPDQHHLLMTEKEN